MTFKNKHGKLNKLMHGTKREELKTEFIIHKNINYSHKTIWKASMQCEKGSDFHVSYALIQ